MSSFRTDAPNPTSPAVIEASARSRTVSVTWADGVSDEFHFVWLRDNCPCAECRHPHTLERTLDPLSWSLELRPESVSVSHAGDVVIAWEGGHLSTYDTRSLRDHRYSRQARARRRRPIESWDATFATRLPKFQHAEVMDDERALHDWLAALRRWGLAVLSDCPRQHLEVLSVAGRISYPRQTNFGIHFDVVSKPIPNNNAYTPIALGAHTDLPNWANPPGFQLLHCLNNEAAGGDSLFVDGARVVELLDEESPAALEVLSRMPLDFRFQDDLSDIRCRAPALSLEEDGSLSVLRYNQGVLDVLDLPFELMEPVYRAHRTLSALLRRSELEVRFRLSPGDLVIFDNHRVLHGRTAFDPQSGHRHFQGCYVEHDELVSRLRVLERKYGDGAGRSNHARVQPVPIEPRP